MQFLQIDLARRQAKLGTQLGLLAVPAVFLAVLAVNALILWLVGPIMLAYLALSTFFALGLHPHSC